ncbi:MAG: hypothetical protein WBW61_05450 [Rhodanobacteraceae bacterium]
MDKKFERVFSTAYRDRLLNAAKAYDRGDYDHAFKLIRRNACAGDKSSQAALGKMYLLGQGVERNDLIGYAWLKTAGEYQFMKTRAVARKLHQAMTPKQREVADAKAHELLRLYGMRASGMSCETRASQGGHITDMVYCQPRSAGSIADSAHIELRRCAQPAPD